MFIKKVPVQRIFHDSGRLANRPNHVLNHPISGTMRAATLTSLFTRCYSKDNNKPFRGDTPIDNNVSKDDDSVEIFDVEEEKRKFYASGNLSSKYTIFKDEDSPIILDVEEERLASQSAHEAHLAQPKEFDGISFTRMFSHFLSL